MNKNTLLDRILEKNNGYIETFEVEEEDISRVYFHDYVKENNLIKVSHGIYMREELWPDDLYIISLRYPDAIYSHEVAAYLHGLSDREPSIVSLTFPAGKSSTRLNKEGVKVYKIREDLFELGLVKMNTTMSNSVRVYDKERTICDIIRSRSNIEVQEFQGIMRAYFHSKDKNIHKLMRYAKKFSVDSLVKEYAEMLL